MGCSRGAGAGGSPPLRSPPVPCIAHGCQCCGATGSFTPSRHHFLRAAVCNAAALRGQPACHCLWAPCRAPWCRSGTAAGGAVSRPCPSIHLVRSVAAAVAATHGFPLVALVRVEGCGAGHWVVVLMGGDGAAPSRAQTPPPATYTRVSVIPLFLFVCLHSAAAAAWCAAAAFATRAAGGHGVKTLTRVSPCASRLGGGGVSGPWGVPLNPRTLRGREVSGLPPLSQLTGVALTQPLSHSGGCPCKRPSPGACAIVGGVNGREPLRGRCAAVRRGAQTRPDCRAWPPPSDCSGWVSEGGVGVVAFRACRPVTVELELMFVARAPSPQSISSNT